jgi:PAS domain S-box-containing protein
MDEFGRRREDWVIEDTPMLLAIVTFELRLMNLNQSWEKVLGYPRVMLAGKPLTRLIDQGEHALALTLLNTRPAAADTKPIEFGLRCYDGSYRCFEWERRPAREEEGVFIAGRDITERKRMETTANLQRYLQSRKSERPA